ncbi:VOC family protein [Myceligenerans pegani]|uniref:VOC family protein n=1 Tax=Myceligenerans pegani TaxID=2776917 RepID=A0ABR9MWA3_9MICO|nr:VOC family protein [Myceligenerans sp. TRM 65318]MBE1875395.1 VOC family protein [Myceligenerans sp. TRM 65318]MBE3017666.1 VOC family protein [Myceligenerans sp. TRM 65318]
MNGVTIHQARQVRLVTDLWDSLAYYRDVLGCEVDDWGHAVRGGLNLLLQQAEVPAHVRPNPRPAERDTYPTDWQGPEQGWDTYVFVDFADFEPLVSELRERGARIAFGPVAATHDNGMTFKNVAVRDPDGYTIVFGCGSHEPVPDTMPEDPH